MLIDLEKKKKNVTKIRCFNFEVTHTRLLEAVENENIRWKYKSWN